MTISQPVSSAGSTPGMLMPCDSRPFMGHRLLSRLREMRANGFAQHALLELDRPSGVHHVEAVLLNQLLVFDQDARLKDAIGLLGIGVKPKIHARLVPLELRTPG